jgi:hypothetical protein
MGSPGMLVVVAFAVSRKFRQSKISLLASLEHTSSKENEFP